LKIAETSYLRIRWLDQIWNLAPHALATSINFGIGHERTPHLAREQTALQ